MKYNRNVDDDRFFTHAHSFISIFMQKKNVARREYILIYYILRSMRSNLSVTFVLRE